MYVFLGQKKKLDKINTVTIQISHEYHSTKLWQSKERVDTVPWKTNTKTNIKTHMKQQP
jgi:hypothetical protein